MNWLFDLNSFCVVWCGMPGTGLSTGILAWYWLEVHLCVKRHLPWIQWEFVLWKLRVGNWELCLICISWRLTDVNLDLLPGPCRFPFGQALAEALKTNTSVTRIYLARNSIGDEGVHRPVSVPGFQVAAHGVFVASFGERFCSLLMLILRISRFPIFVDCQWSGWIDFSTWTHSVWYDVVCLVLGFLLGYWHDIGWKCISVSNDICPESSGSLFFGNSESETESCVSFVFHDVSQMSTLIYFQVHVAFPSARH